jgi:hypothetical protein
MCDGAKAMALIPVEFARPLASPGEAERMFRALGEKSVGVRGLHTRDPARIAALIAAIERKREHSIAFEAGAFDAAAFAAIDALAVAKYQFFGVESPLADLRIWPWYPRAWVLATSASADAIRRAAPREVTVDIKDGEGWVVHCETTDFAAAARLFRAIAGDLMRQGHITQVADATRPLLERAIVAMRAEVHVTMEIAVGAARALAEQLADSKYDWQADGMIADFPSGRLTKYFVSHSITDRKRAKWLRRVEKALKKAAR